VKKSIAALVISTGLLLTGCSQVNEAASIGDSKIAQTDLQATVDAILAERAKVDTAQMQLASGQDLVRGQLRFKILIQIYDAIAKELDLKVTNAMIAQKRSEIISQIGGEEKLPESLVSAMIAPDDLDPYLRAIATSDLITAALIQSGVAEAEAGARISTLLTAKAAELNIKINPRYGTWDPATGDIVAVDTTGGAVTTPAK
jgi:hypothetical protein